MLPKKQVPPIKIKADASGMAPGTPAKIEVYEMYKEDSATDVLVNYDTEVKENGTVEAEWDCKYPKDKVRKPPMFVFKVRLGNYMMTVPKTFGIRKEDLGFMGAKVASISTFDPMKPPPSEDTIDICGQIQDMKGNPRKKWPFDLRRGGADGQLVTNEKLAGATTENEFKDGHWISDEEGQYRFEALPKDKYFIAPLSSGGETKPGKGEKLEVDNLERDEENILFIEPVLYQDPVDDRGPDDEIEIDKYYIDPAVLMKRGSVDNHGEARYRKTQNVKDDYVFDLQTDLTSRGFHCGTPDGVFGAMTEEAVKKFQEYAQGNKRQKGDEELTTTEVFTGQVTGTVDPGTAKEIKKWLDRDWEKPLFTLPKNLHPMRRKIIDMALSAVGRVSDRGGEGGKKKGWQLLKEIYDTALGVDTNKYGWLPGIQTPGQRAGSIPDSPDKNKRAGISWCGIFATWAVIKAGVPGVQWVLGKKIKGLPNPSYDKKFAPGDILVIPKNVHHFILAQQDGDKLTTIDGNTMYQEIKVCHHHPAGEIAYYYKTWPEVYVGEGG
jgi:peptidoglycan hydrolase-like protein with peptidoglycan-binding domain